MLKVETGTPIRSRIIHGNQVGGIRPGRFEGLTRTGAICEMTEKGEFLNVTKNEDEYHQLARRYGRYKRLRTDALAGIREIRGQSGGPISL